MHGFLHASPLLAGLLALQLATNTGACLAQLPASPPSIPTLDQTIPPPASEDLSIPEQSFRASNASMKGRFILDPKTALITGSLTIKWDNGESYSGQMKDGKRQGQGTFIWQNGQSYTGAWQNDLPEGRGSLRFANGDLYEGDIKAGVPEGFGIKHFTASGDRYEGQFKAGGIDGFGTYADKSGNRYTGQWQAGIKQGKGKYEWQGGQRYEGEWAQDQPNGQGEIVFATGDRYVGTVKAGLPEGLGEKIFASSGDHYTGELSAGEAHGQGRYLWKNGDVFQGAWVKGRKTGPGRYTWADGDYWEGQFIDDRQAEGRLYFTPTLDLAQASAEKLLQQARAASDVSSPQKGPEKTLNISQLASIPMVSLELKSCDQPSASTDCRTRILSDIEQGRLFKHAWQTMFSDKNSTGATISYEVDKNSASAAGKVYSWFRFLNANTGLSRNTGIKYECRSESLEIQLLYNCSGGAEASTCTLDRNFDKYVGKSLPAATIKGWFKNACDRGG